MVIKSDISQIKFNNTHKAQKSKSPYVYKNKHLQRTFCSWLDIQINGPFTKARRLTNFVVQTTPLSLFFYDLFGL